MQFTREINRLLAAVLVAFALVAISAAYWAVIGPESLLGREDNPRLVEAEAAIIRGDIVGHDGQLLATSIQNDDYGVTRQYLHPATNGALGYFSLRYGVGGMEAFYDDILRGDDLPYDLTRNLLHYPQEGSDIRVTIDLSIQQQVVDAMDGHTGAAVVMAVPGGEILALVSLPAYDPNTLDEEWESLVDTPGNPFFNRVTQGSYQPGGVLQIPLMATALLNNRPVNEPIENATRAVNVDDVTLNCALPPQSDTLTLTEAFTYACPAPFAQLAETIGADIVQTAFDTFYLNEPPALSDLIEEPVGEATPETAETTETPESADTLLELALGQGQLTITPLNIAMIAAAIINDGNAPQPYTLLEIRRPDTDTWTPITEIRPSLPFMTADISRQLQDLMRESASNGTAQNARHDGLDIGGHAALAYSGEGAQAWFVGFLLLDNSTGIAVAVVLEDNEDSSIAASIGGTALEAAFHTLPNP